MASSEGFVDCLSILNLIPLSNLELSNTKVSDMLPPSFHKEPLNFGFPVHKELLDLGFPVHKGPLDFGVLIHNNL